MDINLEISVDLSELEKRLDFDDAKLYRMSAAAIRGMNRLVPVDTFKLRNGVHIEGSDTVVYSRGVDYAGYVHEMPQSWIRTAGTYAQWPERYVLDGAKEVVEEVERIVGGQ